MPNGVDNCPLTSNPGQGDLDGDGTGTACDPENTVPIDINPDEDDPIELDEDDEIEVAILSTAAFDAPSRVDRDSLTFGRIGDEESLIRDDDDDGDGDDEEEDEDEDDDEEGGSGAPACRVEDVNEDGSVDLVCKFDAQKTGFQLADTEGILKSETVDSTPIGGRDSVRIVQG